MGGSDVMCRGMTSAGGKLDEDFAANTVVVRDILGQPSIAKPYLLYSDLSFYFRQSWPKTRSWP